MALFSVSDIVIAVTLLVNALALISSKIPRVQSTGKMTGSFEAENDYPMVETPATSATARLRVLVFGLRKFSCIIVFWNIFFMILMVFVFGG